MPIYMKIDEAPGSCTEKEHKDWIELQTLSWSASNSSSFQGGSANAGGGTGKTSISDIHMVKEMDKSTPKLFEFCTTGKALKKIKIECIRQGNNNKEFEIELNDAIFNSYSVSDHAGSSEKTQESISVTFAKVNYRTTQYKQDGSAETPQTVGYDLTKLAKV